MRISTVSQFIHAENRKIEHAKKVDKTASNRLSSTDLSHISVDGQKLNTDNSSINTITASLSSVDDIRTDKIIEVQEKLKKGYYNSPEFLDKLAEKLLAEFGIKPTD